MIAIINIDWDGKGYVAESPVCAGQKTARCKTPKAAAEAWRDKQSPGVPVNFVKTGTYKVDMPEIKTVKPSRKEI